MSYVQSDESGSQVWEVERDRFGVMFSGPLEVGECVRVVSAERHEAEMERMRRLLKAGSCRCAAQIEGGKLRRAGLLRTRATDRESERLEKP